MSQCICELAGFCERHKVEKTEKWIHLCRHDERYWQAWEQGKGPGQHGPRPNNPTRKRHGGPGTELQLMLKAKGYRYSSGCGCSDKAFQMNSWGVNGCRERIDEIVDWLLEAAKARGWLTKIAVSTPGIGSAARSRIRGMVEEAIANAKAKEDS